MRSSARSSWTWTLLWAQHAFRTQVLAESLPAVGNCWLLLCSLCLGVGHFLDFDVPVDLVPPRLADTGLHCKIAGGFMLAPLASHGIICFANYGWDGRCYQTFFSPKLFGLARRCHVFSFITGRSLSRFDAVGGFRYRGVSPLSRAQLRLVYTLRNGLTAQLVISLPGRCNLLLATV